MKNNNIIILLLTAIIPHIAYAQLETDALGHISMGNTTPNGNSILYMRKVLPETSNPISYGINVHLALSQNNVVGIESFAAAGNSYSASSTGILGYASDGNYNTGVSGSIMYENGAGIFGSYDGTLSMSLPASYAGYFHGNIYVDNNITATNYLKQADANLQEDIRSLSSIQQTSSATLQNLMDMNVITYKYKDLRQVYPEMTKTKLIKEGDTYKTITIKNKDDVEEFADVSKPLHYGLSVDDVLRIYPDLVQKGQDGFYGIDYTELIPILIKSIQELKQELENIKVKSGGNN